jgi:small multidrug resistance pump
LSSIPVGVAYAVWSSVGIVLILVLDWVIYDQKLNYSYILGMFLIIVGVVI